MRFFPLFFSPTSQVLEFFQNLTRSEQVMEDPTSEYYMDMNKIIEDAKKLQLKRKKIEKYAKDFMASDRGKNNIYAQLYSVYSD